MNKLTFFVKSFNGKGWFIPLSDLLNGTEFKNEPIQLADRNVFNLADVLRLINSNKLNETLLSLNIDPRKANELEGLLVNQIVVLKSFDKRQKWVLPGLMLGFVLAFIISNYLVEIFKPEIKAEKKTVNTEIYQNGTTSYGSNSSSSQSGFPNSLPKSSESKSKSDLDYDGGRTYRVAGSNFTFARTKFELDQLLEAARNDDGQKINKMIIDGTIITFPVGKEVYLIDQGISTIVIKDPQTGDIYYGVTESIR